MVSVKAAESYPLRAPTVPSSGNHCINQYQTVKSTFLFLPPQNNEVKLIYPSQFSRTGEHLFKPEFLNLKPQDVDKC